MADMSLCGNSPLPLEKCANCYRNPANTKPSPYWQSWIAPAVSEPNVCPMYWSMEPDADNESP